MVKETARNKTIRKEKLTLQKNDINYLNKNMILAEKNLIKKVDKMKGIEFEYFLADLYRKKSYQVEVTPASNDQGADLILKKGNSKIAVQAKRYKSKVSNKAVQEVFSAQNYYGCEKSMVVTNSYFTNSAKKLATVNNVELCNRDYLIQELNKISVS